MGSDQVVSSSFFSCGCFLFPPDPTTLPCEADDRGALCSEYRFFTHSISSGVFLLTDGDDLSFFTGLSIVAERKRGDLTTAKIFSLVASSDFLIACFEAFDMPTILSLRCCANRRLLTAILFGSGLSIPPSYPWFFGFFQGLASFVVSGINVN